MYKIDNKATELFESGKREEAVKLLEDFIKGSRNVTDRTVFSMQILVDFLAQMNRDYDEYLLFLEKQEIDSLWAHIRFRLGWYYRKNGEAEKAAYYFRLYRERCADPDQISEAYGFSDEWNEVKQTLNGDSEKTSDDLYGKCEYGANLSVLTEEEADFILCEAFVETVNADGFDSYFSSDFSVHCVRTQKLLQDNASKDYANALKKAIGCFPKDFDFSDPPKTEDYIDEHEKISERLEKLEEKIYDSDEDIDSILEKLKSRL